MRQSLEEGGYHGGEAGPSPHDDTVEPAPADGSEEDEAPRMRQIIIEKPEEVLEHIEHEGVHNLGEFEEQVRRQTCSNAVCWGVQQG